MSDNRPIGIFDSGVGGLTVVHEIFQRLPKESIIYFGDTARVPYGTKSAESVRKFAIQDILFLMKQNVKLIIAACHTVSSVVLDDLNKEHHLPILGVVESGVKAALASTKNRRIGIIGTRGTVMSGTYERKIREKDPDITVISQPCPLFVPLAEEGWLNDDVTQQIASIYLAPVKKQEIDTLILGCTHYPILKDVIRKVIGEKVLIIDSAEETAKLAAQRLQRLNMETEHPQDPEYHFYVSDIPHQFQDVGERFLGKRLSNIHRVDLESIDIHEWNAKALK
jgi:glutamate racemase